MYMFVTDVPLVDRELLPVCDVLEHSLQFEFNERIPEDLSSVFRSPDQMVVAHPGSMGLLIQPSVHWVVMSPLVGNSTGGDFSKDYASKRTHGLKPMVFTCNKKELVRLLEI